MQGHDKTCTLISWSSYSASQMRALEELLIRTLSFHHCRIHLPPRDANSISPRRSKTHAVHLLSYDFSFVPIYSESHQDALWLSVYLYSTHWHSSPSVSKLLSLSKARLHYEVHRHKLVPLIGRIRASPSLRFGTRGRPHRSILGIATWCVRMTGYLFELKIGTYDF